MINVVHRERFLSILGAFEAPSPFFPLHCIIPHFYTCVHFRNAYGSPELYIRISYIMSELVTAMKRKSEAVTAARAEADALHVGEPEKADKKFKKLCLAINRDYKKVQRAHEAAEEEDDPKEKTQKQEECGALSWPDKNGWQDAYLVCQLYTCTCVRGRASDTCPHAGDACQLTRHHHRSPGSTQQARIGGGALPCPRHRASACFHHRGRATSRQRPGTCSSVGGWALPWPLSSWQVLLHTY